MSPDTLTQIHAETDGLPRAGGKEDDAEPGHSLPACKPELPLPDPPKPTGGDALDPSTQPATEAPSALDPVALTEEWLRMADGIARSFLWQQRNAAPRGTWHLDQKEQDLIQEARLKLLEVVSEQADKKSRDDLRSYAAKAIWNQLRDIQKGATKYGKRSRGATEGGSSRPRGRLLTSDRTQELIALLPSAFAALRRSRPQLFEVADLTLRQEMSAVDAAARLGLGARTAQRSLEKATTWLAEWLTRNGLD
jgi:hypothetical protein